MSRRLARTGVLDVVSTAIPGIRDVLVLGKVKQLEVAGAADLIVVDAPATGHAITFLTSAAGMVDAARGGPLRTQAQDVVELLSDPARCRVILVTLPEEMPVSETIESAYTLEDKAGVQLGPVIVNACDPEPSGLDRPAAEVAAGGRGDPRPGPPGGARGGPPVPAGPPRSLGRAGGAPGPGAAPAPPGGPGARRAGHRSGRDGGTGRRAGRRGARARQWTRWRRERRRGAAGARAGTGGGRRERDIAPALVAERSVVVCCGSGGVGKTTVSATFALAAARAGGGPAWSRSTRPGGWPTRSGWSRCPTRRPRWRATGRDTSTR